jgi:hypothetical protein
MSAHAELQRAMGLWLSHELADDSRGARGFTCQHSYFGALFLPHFTVFFFNLI